MKDNHKVRLMSVLMKWSYSNKSRHSSVCCRLNSRIIVLFALSLFYASSVFSQITISVKNEPLKSTLKKVEQVSGYKFFYSENLPNLNRTVSISVKNATIEKTLNLILENKNISYKVDENKVVTLMPDKKNNALPKKVSGNVVDDTGEPVIGANILLKGSSNGTITDINGAFVLNDIPENGILVISYLGYQNEEVPVKGKNSLSIVLKENSKVLDEVVVTALGMKREEKALGYSVTKVTAEDLEKAPSNNWLNSLAGKAPGMNFSKGSTGPMGSVRVTLRGESSLNLDNNGALFVVDGVPINNEMTSSGGNAQNVGGADEMPVDFGNGSSDLNPDDIESVSVLKGPAATALYGSRAANGAIVITTKSGGSSKDSKRLNVSYAFGVSIDQVNKWPEYQYQYGNGGSAGSEIADYYHIGPAMTVDGVQLKANHSSQAWGLRFDPTVSYYQMFNTLYGVNVDAEGNRIATPWVGTDYVKDFFKTGVTYKNTVTIEGGNAKDGRMRLSYTNTKNDYIVPNTGYKNHTIAMSADKQINKYINLGAKINYINRSSDNLPAVGYGESSVMYSLLTSAPNTHMSWLKNYWLTPDVEQWNMFNTSADNPYFIAYEQLNGMDRNRVFGNVNLKIDLLKNLSLTLRSGIDFYDENRTSQAPLSSKRNPNGMYREQNVYSNEMNHDFLLTYKNAFGRKKEWGLSASFGGNAMMKTYRTREMRTTNGLSVPGQYTLANSVGVLSSKYGGYKKKVNSFFGLLQLNYGSYVYVDITGRNDWSSTLPKGNNSYFYPSVATSILFNEIFGLQNNPILSLAKLRLSYAMVGNDTGAYRLMTAYSSTDNGYMLPTTLNNKDLKPEKVTSYEIGADLRFFRNRLGIDFTYYQSDSRNLIMNAPIDPAAGFQKTYLNAGHIKNYGFELSMNGTPIQTKDFSLRVNATWSKNKSKVLELSEAIDSWIITTGVRGTVEARVGGTTGSMYGYGFKRVPAGTIMTDENGKQIDISNKIIYNDKGLPTYRSSGDGDMDYLGEITPDWKGSFGFTAKYKGLSCNVLFDGQMGGQVYSVTWQKMNDHGKAANTLKGRYDPNTMGSKDERGIIGDGVIKNADGTYRMNDVKATAYAYYKAYYNINNVESAIVSTSYLKLRELSFEYSFSKSLVAKTKVLQGLSVSIYGRDLFVWTDYPGFDPEAATLNGGNIQPGYETAQMPSTRTFGATIKMNF